MRNLNKYLFEKLVIDKDVEVSKKPNVKVPWIDVLQQDKDKMREYQRKGSKPIRLVNTIKDSEKLKRRFAAALLMKWHEAIREFGKALVSRGIFSQEVVDAYVDKYMK